MPSVSPKQAKLMRIAAHTPGGYGGVPQSVGAEYEAADEAGAKPAKKARLSGAIKGAMRKHGVEC